MVNTIRIATCLGILILISGSASVFVNDEIMTPAVIIIRRGISLYIIAPTAMNTSVFMKVPVDTEILRVFIGFNYITLFCCGGCVELV